MLSGVYAGVILKRCEEKLREVEVENFLLIYLYIFI